MRYLTRRFIGEYRSNTDLLYRQTIPLESGLLDVEIVDVSAEIENDFPIEQIQWADACLIVYSVTDRESYKYATRALANMKSIQTTTSSYLIANKADLDHLREVCEIQLIYEEKKQNEQHCARVAKRSLFNKMNMSVACMFISHQLTLTCRRLETIFVCWCLKSNSFS